MTFAGLPPGRDPRTVYLPMQPQGEAMTWTPDGSALLVAGERDDRLLRVELPAPRSDPATPALATPAPSPTVQLLSSDGGSEQQQLHTREAGGLVVGVAVGLALLGGVVIAIAEWRRRRAPGAPRG